ncbi:UNVERIFIED_CONTAM: hypothetical protein Scaly_1122400 [Sesamum calycinum]|uniref:Uncharacterized protein n=1 Tax=Sesamum calycinum TaxID=2727403 RepID=A0AAW2QM81_9LAMI
MAAARILRMSRPLGLGLSHEVFSSSAVVSRPRTLIMCLNKAGLSSENPTGAGSCSERKPVAVKAAGCASGCVIVSEPKTDKGVDLGMLLGYVTDLMSRWMKFVTKERPWRLNIQMLVEKGCVLVLESYFQYFHAISQMSQQGHVVLLLIEAIDMFLVGTAMLIFGVALHVMFVGQQNLKGKGSLGSTLSGNFNLEKLPSWIGMETAIQAKSKIGQAVIMILQVQVLEKCKSIPVVNGMDIACFAGAIFLSSASLFVLSKIAFARVEARQ